MTKLKKETVEWKIGDKFIMHPIGVDFTVYGEIKTKIHLKIANLFSELYEKQI